MTKRRNIAWDVYKQEYINGDFNASGVPVDLTFQDIADRAGVSLTAVWKRAKKDHWEDARRQYRQSIFDEERDYEEKIRAELRKTGLPMYAEFMSQMGRLCYLIVGKYLKKLTDEKSTVTIYFSDVCEAADRLEKILQFLEGRSSLSETQVDYTWKQMILELAKVPDDRQ